MQATIFAEVKNTRKVLVSVLPCRSVRLCGRHIEFCCVILTKFDSFLYYLLNSITTLISS